MGALVATDVSLSIAASNRHTLGRVKMVHGTMTFGGAGKTYPNGGVPLPTAGKFGFTKEMSELLITDPATGFSFAYDKDAYTLKAFEQAPPIVFEELIDCSADLAYTKYPAAFIMYVASADTHHRVVSGKCTPASGQVAVDLFSATPGKRAKLTFFADEGVASTYVTYITQAWKDVFDNLIEDEELAVANFTAGTPDLFNLANQACAIQNVTWKDAAVIKACTPMAKAVTTLATTEVAVDFTRSTYTTLYVLTTDDWNVTITSGADKVYVTYIKLPASGFLTDRFVEEEDLTPSSDVITLDSPAVDNALLFGTMGGFAASATTKGIYLVRSGATVGTTASIIKQTAGMNLINTGTVVANTFTAGSNHSDSDHLYPSYIYGLPDDITPLVPLEVANGKPVVSKTLRFMAWGR